MLPFHAVAGARRLLLPGAGRNADRQRRGPAHRPGGGDARAGGRVRRDALGQAAPAKGRGALGRRQSPRLDPAAQDRGGLDREGRAPLPKLGPERLCPAPGEAGRTVSIDELLPCNFKPASTCKSGATLATLTVRYRPPAPETIVAPSWPLGSATLRRPSSLAKKPSMHLTFELDQSPGADQHGSTTRAEPPIKWKDKTSFVIPPMKDNTGLFTK